MPTSRAARAAVAVILAGCVTAPAPVQSVAVARGEVTVAGPPGYCVDRGLVRDDPAGAFVALGSCAGLGGTEAPAGPPALLTATVANVAVSATPDAAALEAFLRSEAGRTALSRAGQSGSVEIVDTRREGEVLLLQIRDTGAPAAGPPTEPEYWRAVFDVRGRLVTATALAFAGRPLPREEGFRTLGAFVARLRAANAPPA